MQMLYVGKMVHYRSYGTPNGEYLPEARAAVVTEIKENNVVGLCVLNPTGQFFNPEVSYAETPTPGCWNFIPEEIKGMSLSTPIFHPPMATVGDGNPPEPPVATDEDALDKEETCGKQKYAGPQGMGVEPPEYCIRIKDHPGDHESWSGATWPNYDDRS